MKWVKALKRKGLFFEDVGSQVRIKDADARRAYSMRAFDIEARI